MDRSLITSLHKPFTKEDFKLQSLWTHIIAMLLLLTQALGSSIAKLFVGGLKSTVLMLIIRTFRPIEVCIAVVKVLRGIELQFAENIVDFCSVSMQYYHGWLFYSFSRSMFVWLGLSTLMWEMRKQLFLFYRVICIIEALLTEQSSLTCVNWEKIYVFAMLLGMLNTFLKKLFHTSLEFSIFLLRLSLSCKSKAIHILNVR
jgi:hypothetical protein